MQEIDAESEAPQLLAFIAENLAGCASVELRRKAKTVRRWVLGRADGEPLGVDELPSDTAEQITAALVEASEASAARLGPSQYRVTMHAVRPARGPKPEPRSYSMHVGDGEVDSPKSRTEETAFALFRGVSTIYLDLLTKTTALVEKQGGFLERISDTHAKLMEHREQAGANHLQLALIEQQAATAARREKMAADVLLPFVMQARKSWGIGGGAPTIAESGDPLVAKARALHRSFTAAQLATLATHVGPSILDRLRDGDGPHIVAAIADLLGLADSKLLAAINVLTAEQEPLLADLQDYARTWTQTPANQGP